MANSSSRPRVLICIIRHDLRLSDNPIFYHAAKLIGTSDDASSSSNPSSGRSREDSLVSEEEAAGRPTHLLPVYIFPANQVEVSGFLSPGQTSPFPEARSQTAGVWRTGPHRLKFIADGVWDLKESLKQHGSDLEIRAGMVGDTIRSMVDWYAQEKDRESESPEVSGIWITGEEGTEEKHEERVLKRLAEENHLDFRVWHDEKFFVDDRDLPFDKISDLPNVYTTYRKSVEPLRSRPRDVLPTPSSLPPLPTSIPPQESPFEMPQSLEGLKKKLLEPMEKDPSFGLSSPPRWPSGTESAHPFVGGETAAQERLSHLVSSGAMSSYKATRNGMLGLDFSTKLSAYLAQGNITARQVHHAMLEFEEGRGEGTKAPGYGKGENEGTAAVRFELLWRDYMRLCARKFGSKMYHVEGIQEQAAEEENNARPSRKRWRYIDHATHPGDDPAKTLANFTRFRSGRTGTGLIDAANRELFLTGYTSNRARQNVASFLASHLGIDWRLGAEWYEFLLVDYDVGSNWGNWQYVAGVGNDPRQGRVFNPVKQALDYDGRGEYVRAWVPELRGVQITNNVQKHGEEKEEVEKERLMGVFQAWRLREDEKRELGLKGVDWVDAPLVRINFSVGRKGGGDGDRGKGRGRGWRGRGRGGRSRDMRRLGQEERAWRGGWSGGGGEPQHF